MVSPKKCRLQVTFHKETVAVLDKLVTKLSEMNPLQPYSRSSVLEGAFMHHVAIILAEMLQEKEKQEKAKKGEKA